MRGDGHSEGVASRDIVVHARTGGLHRKTECNCEYDSLHYVLLFPTGNNVWNQKIPHSRGKGDVTALEYYCSRLMMRTDLSYLHMCGTLPSIFGGYAC